MNTRIAAFQEKMKSKGYSRRTIESYVWYANDFGKFLLSVKDASTLTPGQKIERYLSALYTKGRSRVTQNVAFNALILFYKLECGMTSQQIGTVSAPRHAPTNYIPTVLRPEEVRKIIDAMDGLDKLIVAFLYGTGLRIHECNNLRVKDLDFAGHKVRIYSGKGGKARSTILPDILVLPLQKHLENVKQIHDQDLRQGFGRAELPHGCGMPVSAESKWELQYVFPATRISDCLDAVGIRRRWYYHPDNVRKAIRATCQKIDERRPITPHTFRHSFATKMLFDLIYPANPENRLGEHDARKYVKNLMGHVSEKTFDHYTRTILEWASPRIAIRSPMDAIAPSR